MAERQGSGRVTGWAHWILAITLMLWGHQISGQGQGKYIFFFYYNLPFAQYCITLVGKIKVCDEVLNLGEQLTRNKNIKI